MILGPTHRPAGAHAGAEVLDDLHEVVFRTDPDGVWTYLNLAWERLTGFPVEETLGGHFLDHVHPDERDATIDMFMAVIIGGADFCHHESRYGRADGSYGWVEIRAHVLRDEHGIITGNAGTIVDIDARRRAEELLADQTTVLEAITADRTLADVLGAVATMAARQLGSSTSIAHLPAGRRPGPARAGARPPGPPDPPSLDAAGVVVTAAPDGTVGRGFGAGTSTAGALPIRAAGDPTVLGILMVDHPTGTATLTGEERRVVARAVELAALAMVRAQRETELHRRALLDPLTSLPNRYLLEDRFEKAAASARRRGSSTGVLLIDLDGFKHVNDSLGHETGDRVLQEVARRFGATVRAADTVGRYGGDEFVVVLADVDGALAAERVAAKLLSALEAPIEVDGVGLRARASVGIALCPAHGDDFPTLVARADAAMYRVKPWGGGSTVFESDDDTVRATRVASATELGRAIAAGELRLHYQPKIDLRDGRAVGVEALVRWQHPTRGLVPPNDFIGLAEGTGLIKPLTWWVLETALAEMDTWSGSGAGLTMAVNLSAQMLRDPELSRTVVAAVERWGLADRRLELEVTESALLADPDTAIGIMGELDAAGISFALDDFGTGYSSLSQLKLVPARTLKIDKSFVKDVTTDGRDASIVQAVVHLGHDLGIDVVAEGVEQEEMADRVGELGCDLAQGFYLARPMAGPDLVTWLAAR